MGGGHDGRALRRVVRANLSHGVDWIKVTRHRTRRHARHGSAQAESHSQEELEVIVSEAASKDVPVRRTRMAPKARTPR